MAWRRLGEDEAATIFHLVCEHANASKKPEASVIVIISCCVGPMEPLGYTYVAVAPSRLPTTDK